MSAYDSYVTIPASKPPRSPFGCSSAGPFDSQAAFAKITSEWPLSRFVEIWNSIPGQPATQKFANRGKAVSRIWKAIQPLARNVESNEEKGKTSKKPVQGAKSAAKPRVRKQAAPKKSASRHSERSNKKAAVIAMMKRARGATLPEIMKATSWQAHTVRGFVSILGSKGGQKIESTRNAAGERTYRVPK